MNISDFLSVQKQFLYLMSAKDLQKLGLSKTMAYQLLNRADMPVVCIGSRKFMRRDEFFAVLSIQTITTTQTSKMSNIVDDANCPGGSQND